ncbi:MAG: helix-turn-helix domain-containing protein [Muribaculum sp.]|nr:helix-turn-helix domain-containing protein [Muribaculum sp.]
MSMSARELDVLDILWGTDKPMMATEIVDAVTGLTQSTVTAVLRKLLRAKLVEVAGITHSGKVLSRTYRPTEASREAIISHMLGELERFKNVVTIQELEERQQVLSLLPP